MAEYIDRENVKSLIEVAIEDNWDLDYTLQRLKEINPADVIERAEYDELNEKYFKAIHNHTECLKKLHELRAEIDKAKKQITDSMNEHLASDGTPIDEYAYCYLNVLEILEENIGE